MIEVKLPGQPFPRVDKRAAEIVTYLVDCSVLLDKNELIVSAEVLDPPAGTTISNVRTRKGKNVEIKIATVPVTTAAYIDNTINLLLRTSMDNTRLASFIVRVYK